MARLVALVVAVASLGVVASAQGARSSARSDAQVAALVTRGITAINTAKAAAALKTLAVVKVELSTAQPATATVRTAKALALQGFDYAIKQLGAQLKAAQAMDEGDLDAATKALDIPATWSTWATLVRKAQNLLHLKVKLAARFK